MLRTDLTDEVTRAETAEGVLRTDLDAEVTRAETAEALLAPLDGPLFTGDVTLSTGDMNVSTGNIVLNSKVAGKGLIQFAARDTPETVPYKMGVAIDGNSDKLVIKKGDDVLMSISDNGYSDASAVDTITFSAPVVMTDILDLTSAGCKIQLSSDQYITGADFLSFLSSSSITKHNF